MSKLHNFRDLGGIHTTDGRKIRKNRLLRAAEPSGLHSDDIKMLMDCGLAQIIDFRNQREIAIAPVSEISGASYYNFDVNRDRERQYTISAQEWRASINVDIAEAAMMDGYRGYVTLPSATAAFRDFLRACIAQREGATLFHCHAGKDRTGYAAAVLLKLLGVSDADIYADYLQTLADVEVRRPSILAQLRAESDMNETQIAAYEVIYDIKREWLEAAFITIDEMHGSFEAYVANVLGITADEIAALQDIYLEATLEAAH